MADRQNIVELVKNLLFPKFCAGCEQEGSWLCDKCLPAAFVGAAEPNGCAAVGEAGYLNGVTALFDYGENTVSNLIKMFKYKYLLEIAGIFEKIIDKSELTSPLTAPLTSPCPPLKKGGDDAIAPLFKEGRGEIKEGWQGFTIIPVPLHARRERERGFNQAEVLAKLFSKKFGLAINKNLRRVIYTAQQVKLSGEERRKNLKNAFVWGGEACQPGLRAPEKVLLVDDVFTTGATMRECAKVLKSNGTKVVWGLVLARD